MSSTKGECPERSPGAMGGEGPVFGFRNVPRDCQPGFTGALCPQARSGRGPHPSRDAISAILVIAGGVQPTLGLAVWLLRALPIPARVPESCTRGPGIAAPSGPLRHSRRQWMKGTKRRRLRWVLLQSEK